MQRFCHALWRGNKPDTSAQTSEARKRARRRAYSAGRAWEATRRKSRALKLDSKIPPVAIHSRRRSRKGAMEFVRTLRAAEFRAPAQTMEPGGFEPPSTRGISGRIRRFRESRSARRSAGCTRGETRRRTRSDGRPDRGTSPAHVAAERRGRPRPARRRPGPPRGGVGQPAPRRACWDRRGAWHANARPLTPPDARQNRRNPRCRDAAGHRRPFRRRRYRHGSFPPIPPTRRPREQPRG